MTTDEPRLSWPGQLLAAAWFAAVVGWLVGGAFGEGEFLGAPRTDVFRAVWGLDQQWQGLPTPFWTDRVGFPAGVKVVVLPQVSALLGAPLVPLLGAVGAYNLWIAALLWATGMASAWLVRTLTRSDAAGVLAGTFVLAQPMMFVALTDGTAEFVAFWAVPAALAAVWHLREDPRWGWVAGALLTVVALDSPYHAVFTLPLLPLVLGRAEPRAWRNLGGALALGALVLGGLYYGLPVEAPNDRSAQNAVILRVWEQWETGHAQRGWDFSLGAAFIPSVALAGLVGLAVLRPVRAAPWLLAALLMLAWSLSTHPENPGVLARWLGAPGAVVGDAVTFLNTHLAPPVVRFPRRWLVAVALAVGAAGGIGLTRVPWEPVRWVVALLGGGACLWAAEQTTHFRRDLPVVAPPHPAFAEWVAEHPADGAVLFLPRVRGARAATGRDHLPVFANLSPDLASSDLIWLQVRTGRASVFRPDGLRTLTARYGFGEDLGRLLHDLDDLANPQTTGNPIPPSATQDPEVRAQRARRLVEEGVRFVVLDEATMGEEGLRLARATFADLVREERRFEDGTGVSVWVVAP